MQEGKVVEQGTHDVLFGQPDSAYRALVQLQQQAMDERAAMHAEAEAAVDEDEEIVLPVPVQEAEVQGSQKQGSFKQGSSKKALETSLKAAGDDEKEELVRCPSTALLVLLPAP